MRLMSYDEAKVFECCRTGVGGTFGEIKRLLQWPTERVIKAAVGLASEEWLILRQVGVAFVFTPTAQGEQAYQRWAELPF